MRCHARQAHANAGLRVHILACRLLRKLVRKPKVCRSAAPAAPVGDVILRNYAILNAVFTPFSVRFLRLASLARRSLNQLVTELPEFWDAVSAPGLYRKRHPVLNIDSGMQFPSASPVGKVRPILNAHSGMQFPPESPPGKRIPV